MQYTTEDGYTLRVFSSMYIDWGLEIMRGDRTLYYCPCALSNESYGFKPNPKFDDWEDAEEAALDGDENAFIQWDDKDWEEGLRDEADTFIECYVDPTDVTCVFCGEMETVARMEEDPPIGPCEVEEKAHCGACCSTLHDRRPL
tara:strand:- start:440 stop:871 length:432 start_codon:yes stop_codon:yes gene_type:complete